MLNSDAGLVNSGYWFTSGAPINTNAERTPWIGVQRGIGQIAPEQVMAGAPSAWRGTQEFFIFHQWQDWNAPPNALNGIEAANDYIATLVCSNLTLDGQRLILAEISTEILNYERETQEAFFTGAIRLAYNVRSP